MLTFPAPEVPRRLATLEETPKTARALARAAAEAGWLVRVTYARGTWSGAQGQPTNVVDTIRVRMQMGVTLGAIGAWNDGKFSFGYIWSRFSTVPRKVGSRDLRAFVVASARMEAA